jgi:hypothetical protein
MQLGRAKRPIAKERKGEVKLKEQLFTLNDSKYEEIASL